MPTTQNALEILSAVPKLSIKQSVPLSQYTRFGIGGPADILADAGEEAAFAKAFELARLSGLPFTVLGQGTNLIVSDDGFRGIVLRYTASTIRGEGNRISVDAGAVLQHLVDFSIELGLEGLHAMTGIPGWVGAAIYGNAGAYGHSISEFVRRVRLLDASGAGAPVVREIDNAACQFEYRESVFKRRKDWLVLSAELELPAGDRAALRRKAEEILAIRNAKYPPMMKCAGSIFKNLLLKNLPEGVRKQVPAAVIREGKVPAAWFLEQAGAKGRTRGKIEVASYHANLIYNTGGGTAAELCALIQELKTSVQQRFGILLEEEVQYVG
jgi:UDP-N-acetylmuramate dehydrogenase